MSDRTWWQRTVFYQIYPRSFADGDGDGIGDFAGMTAKLDYLRELGVDAIWLSPHFPSPFLDCGYDISDYDGVAPEYGTMEDFQTFLREAHAREIRVVLDLPAAVVGAELAGLAGAADLRAGGDGLVTLPADGPAFGMWRLADG